MWEDHSTAPLNCVYLGYPLGALSSILIVGIFRKTDYSKSELLNKRKEFQSDLVGPYLIISICCLISSIGFGLITFKEYQQRKINKKKSIEEKRKLKKENFWMKSSPTTCGQGFILYGFCLISLLFLFNFFFGK